MKKLEEIIKATKLPPKRINIFSGLSPLLDKLPYNVALFYYNKIPYDATPSLHHRYIFCFCISGPAKLVVDSMPILLEPNEGILVFPYQHHYYLSINKKRANSKNVLWLYLSFELDADPKLSSMRNKPFKLPDKAKNLIYQIFESYYTAGEKADIVAPEVPFLFGALLAVLLYEPESHFIPIGEFEEIDSVLRKITDYIHKNYHKKIRIKDIARHLSMSESNLRRVFRKHAPGTSLGNFIRRIKIYNSYRLLTSTVLSITEIAEKCGFNSIYDFSRAFKREASRTPLEYRKLHSTRHSA